MTPTQKQALALSRAVAKANAGMPTAREASEAIAMASKRLNAAMPDIKQLHANIQLASRAVREFGKAAHQFKRQERKRQVDYIGRSKGEA